MNYLYIRHIVPVLPINRHPQRDINAKECEIYISNMHMKC
jgi:hypothetical protein